MPLLSYAFEGFEGFEGPNAKILPEETGKKAEIKVHYNPFSCLPWQIAFYHCILSRLLVIKFSEYAVAW